MKKLGVLVLVALFFCHGSIFTGEPTTDCVTIDGYSIPVEAYNHCMDQITDIFNNYRNYALQHVIDPIIIGKKLMPKVLYTLQSEFGMDLSSDAHRAVIRNFYNNLFVPIYHYEIWFHEYRMCKSSMKKAVAGRRMLYTMENVLLPIIDGKPVKTEVCEQFKKEFNLNLLDLKICAMIKYGFTP